MISVLEAKNNVQENTRLLAPVSLAIGEALGLILAENVYSKIDFPPFDQSSMDGYAICFSDWKRNNSLTVSGEIPAGTFPKKKLKSCEAMRIFTGAPLPVGADTVVMQEKIIAENGKILINDLELTEGAYVRKKGAQNSAGSLALKTYTKLTPAALAYLASLGVTEVNAFPHPKVCIVTTGNELKSPGEVLANGEVYECNSTGLFSVLKELNITGVKYFSASDDEQQITEVITNNLKDSDIIIVTGGVSVGDYDFVPKVFEKCGVEKIFHNVKQKPGKPLYFGKYNNTLLFGLPGNPLSVLCCYYEYVLPAIKKMMGYQTLFPLTIKMPLSCSITKKQGLTFFVIGKISDGKVEPLPDRESYQLSSFAIADCIIQLDENDTDYHFDRSVSVHLLSQ